MSFTILISWGCWGETTDEKNLLIAERNATNCKDLTESVKLAGQDVEDRLARFRDLASITRSWNQRKGQLTRNG
jgi:hypothetical protein